MDAYFKNPPDQFRAAPFWSWNTDLNKETILRQAGYFKEMGCGGYHISVRIGLDTEYMGPLFMECVKACVDKSREAGSYVYLYDEDRWPSGFAGGKVTENNEFRATYLLFTPYSYREKGPWNQERPLPNFAIGLRNNNGYLLGCYDIVLDKTGYIEHFRQIGENEKTKGVKWYAYIEKLTPHSWYNNASYVDVLNKKAIDKFIETTYEAYKNTVGRNFGKTVFSIFTDEPHMVQKRNLPFSKSLTDCVIPWTEELPKIYQNTYKADIVAKLPELFFETTDDKCKQTRYHYNNCTVQLFTDSFSGNIRSWCQKNGIRLTGHMIFEETLSFQNMYSGDLMRSYRNFDIPGMDLLFDEINMTTAKQVQSIVNQYGKPGAMSEEYGVTNYTFDFRDYKFQGDWQAALGINFRVPHLSHMTIAGECKRDFPPSIFYQAPWFKEYKLIEDYFARINVAMKDSSPVAKIGVIHPIESFWLNFGPNDLTGDIQEQMDDNFKKLNEWLLTGVMDFDYIDEALLPELYEETFEGLKVGEMLYDAIVISDCMTLRSSTIEILESFIERNGKVIITGNAPRFIDALSNSNLQGFIEKCSMVIFEKNTLLNALADVRLIDIRKSNGKRIDKYIYRLRKTGEDLILFIAPVEKTRNKDISSYETIKLFIKGIYSPALYDPINGSCLEIDADYEDLNTVITRDMYDYDSLLLKLRPNKLETLQKPVEVLQWQEIKVDNEWEYSLSEPNVLLLDECEYAVDGAQYNEACEILRAETQIRSQLGFPQRTDAVAQPYTEKHKIKSHRIRLRFGFQTEVPLKKLELALENIENTSLSLDGSVLSRNITGWYVDEKIQKNSIPDLEPGRHTLEAEYSFDKYTSMEPMYLLGDFGLKTFGSKVCIVKKPEKLAWGQTVGQGLDFYGGNIVYRKKVEVRTGKLKIKVSKYRGALIKVFVDGIESGHIIFPPYTLTLTGLAKGEHTIEIILYGNRYNTFGALHQADDSFARANSVAWRGNNENWSPQYNFRAFGILKAPQMWE